MTPVYKKDIRENNNTSVENQLGLNMLMNSEFKRNCTIKSFILLNGECLAKLRLKARRSGAWFRVLKHSERRLLDLSISVVKRVRSLVLAKLLTSLIGRLCEAMESRIVRLIRSEGQEMVRNLSKIANSWGHRTAQSWVKEKGLIQFLVINNLNLLGG